MPIDCIINDITWFFVVEIVENLPKDITKTAESNSISSVNITSYKSIGYFRELL